jgi:uncharacterized protein (DUF433 family)
MSIDILNDAPPWRTDADGAVRVGEGRVLLELVIRAFQDGATAEAIVQRYPSVTLADVYATIAYYLRHPEVVDPYLSDRDRQAAAVRQQIDASEGDLAEIRSRLRRSQIQRAF